MEVQSMTPVWFEGNVSQVIINKSHCFSKCEFKYKILHVVLLYLIRLAHYILYLSTTYKMQLETILKFHVMWNLKFFCLFNGSYNEPSFSDT